VQHQRLPAQQPQRLARQPGGGKPRGDGDGEIAGGVHEPHS